MARSLGPFIRVGKIQCTRETLIKVWGRRGLGRGWGLSLDKMSI